SSALSWDRRSAITASACCTYTRSIYEYISVMTAMVFTHPDVDPHMRCDNVCTGQTECEPRPERNLIAPEPEPEPNLLCLCTRCGQTLLHLLPGLSLDREGSLRWWR